MKIPHIDNCPVCDRCGKYDPIPRGYGFYDGKKVKRKGYNLCEECAKKWDELIRNMINTKKWQELKKKDPSIWHGYADNLLENFVTGMKEKVEFT